MSIQKIKRVAVFDPKSGQWGWENKLVTIEPTKQEKAQRKLQDEQEEVSDAKAEQEALAMRQHRAIRPSVQKLGWDKKK